MRRRSLALVVLAAAFFLPAERGAGQPPVSCDEQVTTLRILADNLAVSRQRAEVEGAQAIARLLQRVKGLEAEVATLKKAPEKKETN